MRRKVDSFIALAVEDLAVARKLKVDHPRHAAFNIEQAAEKLLKAVLTAEGLTFGTQHHQLGALAALLPQDHLWRADLMAFDAFSSYATQTRYPTPGGWMPADPGTEDLDEGIASVALLVDEIKDWCAERLSAQRG